MALTGQRIDWRQLREFAATRLDGSFVVEWRLDGETLLIDVDLQLDPEHPFYEKPRPAEKVCIRPAVIEFPWLESLAVDGGEAGGDAAGKVAGLRAGAIENLWRMHEGPYVLQGAFGNVEIDAERPILRLREA
jgi:hypothetical protein